MSTQWKPRKPLLRSSEEVFAELEQLTRVRGLKKCWAFRHSSLRFPFTWPRDRLADLVAFVQRGKRGWADRDTWSLDEHLARVLSEALVHLAEHTHGVYPGFAPELGDVDSRCAAWEDYLRELAQAFSDYLAYMDPESYQTDLGGVRYRALVARMVTLFDHYCALGG